jgi:hypothetical protein
MDGLPLIVRGRPQDGCERYLADTLRREPAFSTATINGETE